MESATKNHIIYFDWTCNIALKSEKKLPPSSKSNSLCPDLHQIFHSRTKNLFVVKDFIASVVGLNVVGEVVVTIAVGPVGVE